MRPQLATANETNRKHEQIRCMSDDCVRSPKAGGKRRKMKDFLKFEVTNTAEVVQQFQITLYAVIVTIN